MKSGVDTLIDDPITKIPSIKNNNVATIKNI